MPVWNLRKFYESTEDPKIMNDIQESLNTAEKIKLKYYEKLSSPDLTAEELKNFIEENEKFEWKLYHAAQYASLLFNENTMNVEAQKLYSAIQDSMTKISEIMSFFVPQLIKQELKKLHEIRDSHEMKEYKHSIQKIINSKEHILSEESEKVITALRNSSRDAFGQLYNKLTSSYEFEMQVDEQIKNMTGSQMRALRYSVNKDLRRDAMKVFFKKYEEDKLVIENIYNAIIKNYDTEARLRNFKTSISKRNLDNEVSDDNVDTVIDVTTEKTYLVHKYYDWKGKKLGYKLQLPDIYCPLNDVKKHYSWEEAKKIVLDSYYEFDEEIGDIVKSFFDEERIHSEIVKGKNGGAFCSYYLPNHKPFILMNFNGNIRDIMTLAHELGHGIHGTLSSKQKITNYHTPLTMAEVASVFGEMLVLDKLLKDLDGEDRQSLIASHIEDMFSTMFRQNMFARFEIQSHKGISENGMMTWDELSELFLKELKIMFGDSVEIPEEYHHEWAAIPHIFEVPFYVYAYNYANLLVIALYQKYLETGRAFVPAYKELLSSGGCDAPEKLLNKIGIDISKREFWEKGFEFMEKHFIDKLI